MFFNLSAEKWRTSQSNRLVKTTKRKTSVNWYAFIFIFYDIKFYWSDKKLVLNKIVFIIFIL